VSTFGKDFLSAVLAEGTVSGLLQFGPIVNLFRGSEIEPYNFVVGFVKEYGKLPSAETVTKHTQEALTPAKEPSAYYFDLLMLRHQELTIKSAMKEASQFVQVDNKDPEKSIEILATAVMALSAQKFGQQIVDFRDAYDLVIGSYVTQKSKAEKHGLRFGWPYFDKMTGGLNIGDMVSFCGRPAAGKTWQMLYAAYHGWREAAETHVAEYDQSRMFVSMEMPVLQIEQRLAALHTHLNMNHVKNAELGTLGVTRLKKGLTEIKGYGAPFYVVDGNLTATVDDIALIARQLKPAGIFVDGAYLVKHPKEHDRFKRVAENADLMKKNLASIAPTVCSWQFAKTASKKKKDEKVSLDDIGYSDAIGQVSSVVLGIFEDENVETLKQRRIEVLKGRSGEVGSFTTRWDFLTMNFSQVADENVDELQFC